MATPQETDYCSMWLIAFAIPLRGSDSLARTGGDEFLVLVEHAQTRSAILDLAQRLRTALAEPIEIDERTITVTPSVGVAIYPFDGRDPEQLINNSDMAMYDVKRKGRNGVREYDSALGAAATRRMAIERELNLAVKNREFFVHYQPIVNRYGDILGLEALLRWERPGHGAVSPADFIDPLEESGLIIPVGYQLIEMVCRQCREWSEEGIRPVPVHINISPRQFEDPALEQKLKSEIQNNELSHEWIGLEVTEGSMIRDFEECVSTLSAWRAMGAAYLCR